MSYNLKKAMLYLCPSGVLLARNTVTEIVSGFPFPNLEKTHIFNNGSILAWGDDRHDVEAGKIKKNSIC